MAKTYVNGTPESAKLRSRTEGVELVMPETPMAVKICGVPLLRVPLVETGVSGAKYSLESVLGQSPCGEETSEASAVSVGGWLGSNASVVTSEVVGEEVLCRSRFPKTL